MNFTESAFTLDCGGDALVGVVALPERSPSRGVVIVVGGPQYRAGSHRQFTLLARSLAAEGIAALRADVRGMGDSTGAQRGFESLDDDVDALVGAMRARVPGLEHLVVWGLCDGASAALLRVDGSGDHCIDALVLVNPWVKNPQVEARARLKHYYLRRLLQPDFWRRLASGRVGAGAVAGLLGAVRAGRGRAAPSAGADLPFTDRMTRAAGAFHKPLLVVLSGRDQTAQEFIELAGSSRPWQQVLARPTTRRIDEPEADHTFSDAAAMRRVAQATVQWVQAL